MSLEKENWQKNRAFKLCKLHADNSGSQTDIILTNNGSTLTKCPSRQDYCLAKYSKSPHCFRADIQRKTFRPQGRQWCSKTVNGSEDRRKWAFLFTSQTVLF